MEILHEDITTFVRTPGSRTMSDLIPVRPSRKGKEREQAISPVPTDLAEKFIAHQRRAAAYVLSASSTTLYPRPRREPHLFLAFHLISSLKKPRDRSGSSIPPDSPATSVSPRRVHATSTPDLTTSSQQDPDPDEFSRRLKISTSPHSSPRPHQKLHNPNADIVPTLHHQDSDVLVERGPLFDHRNDDPIHRLNFSTMTKPNGTTQTIKRPAPSPRSSVDCVSAWSTAYAQSTLSSNFILSADNPAPPLSSNFILSADNPATSLSSNSILSTDNPAAPLSLFESKPRSETTSTVLSAQLKRLYREIVLLENKISREDEDETLDEPRALKSKEMEEEDTERDRWKRMFEDHKKYVVLLRIDRIILTPSV